MDVLSLAGQPVPAGGAWLWVTAAEARRGGEFTALFLPGHRPAACGGDVLVHLAPAGEPGSGTTAAEVQVWAVAAGSLVRVAAWDPAGLDLWPETVRDPVVFAMGALTELRGARRGRRRPRAGRRDRGSRVGAGRVPVPAHPGERWAGSPGLRPRGRAPAGARPFPRRGGRGPCGRRCGPDTAVTAPPPVPARRRRHAPARARCRADRAGSCGGPRAAGGRGRDGGGVDQQPERGGGLLRDDAVADDLQLAGAGDAGHPGHESRGMPIIHSANAADSRGRPDGPGSAGGGAGYPRTCSQRRIAGSYSPHATGPVPARGAGAGLRAVAATSRPWPLWCPLPGRPPRRPCPFGEQPVSGVGSSRPGRVPPSRPGRPGWRGGG